MEADDLRKCRTHRAGSARAILDRARELFDSSGGNLQDGQALDDALYAAPHAHRRVALSCVVGFAIASLRPGGPDLSRAQCRVCRRRESCAAHALAATPSSPQAREMPAQSRPSPGRTASGGLEPLALRGRGRGGAATGEYQAKAIVGNFAGVVVRFFYGANQFRSGYDSSFSSNVALRRMRSMALCRAV